MIQTEISNDQDDPSRSMAVSKKYLRKIPSRTQRTKASPFVFSQHLEEFDDHYCLQVEFSSESNVEHYNFEQYAGNIFITKDNAQRKKLMIPDDVDLSLLTAGIYEGVYRFNLPKKQM